MTGVMVVNRFQVPHPDAGFQALATQVVTHFRNSAGCRGAQLVRNLDEPQLWAILSDWVDVGSYRRTFNGTEAKLLLIPLLSLAIDEPSAYDDPDELGENRPRGTIG